MTATWVGDELVQPITHDRPCGDDLEDTQLLASFDAFRLFGQSTPLDPAPDWNVIRTRAADALCRSKDLRLLAHLGCALLRTDGLDAFTGTLEIAAAWLDDFWDDAYPQIDDDAILRRNALNAFADPIAVLDGVRRLPLASSRQHGTFSLRDIESAMDAAPRDRAFAAMSRQDVSSLQQAVVRALGALKRIEVRMREGAGADAAPAFDPLTAQFIRIDRVLREQLALRSDGVEPPAVPESPDAAAGSPVRSAALGVVTSRQDAIRALDAVAGFFRQHEPSSPVPLIVDRARRLVSMNFLEVLDDIAPGAVVQARAAGGLKDS